MSQQSALQPLQCPRCMGSHFQKTSFRQYVDGTYSSTPGGELFEASPEVEILVCLCGEPAPPPNRLGFGRELRDSLQDSTEKAKQFRKSTELPSIIVGVLEEFATKAELQSIKASLESFGAALASMEKKP